MDRGWHPWSSLLAAVLAGLATARLGVFLLTTCPTPVQGGRSVWGEPDADTCPGCPVCTCEEELRQPLDQQAGLEWWRLLAAALGAIAGFTAVLLALVSLCWAGVSVPCCRTRAGGRPTPEQLAILAAREFRR